MSKLLTCSVAFLLRLSLSCYRMNMLMFCSARVLLYSDRNLRLSKVCFPSPWLHYHEPTEHRELSRANQQRFGVPAAGSLPALQKWQL